MEIWESRDGAWGVYLPEEVGGGRRAPVAESADGLPVMLVHREPLAVSWANVDVDRAEVVVLLMACRGQQRTAQLVGAGPALRDKPALGRSLADGGALAAAPPLALLARAPQPRTPQPREERTWRSAAWDLHVQLHCVHAQDGVSHVAQHVARGGYPHEGGQLQQLLQLGLPPAVARGAREVSSYPDSADPSALPPQLAGLSPTDRLASDRSMLVPNLMM